MGGPTVHIICMRKGNGLRGRGEDPDAVVDTGGIGETDEGHGRRDFGGCKGTVSKGILQAWQEQGRG